MHPSDQEPQDSSLPLVNALDVAIIMHREAHFGGQFDLMIEYYGKGGKGVQPDFELERIQTLAEMERSMQQNLAGILLTGADAERIAAAKEAYKTLRDLYEQEKPFTKNPRLIADLILSESEEAEEEIAAIVKEKATIVPLLLDLIRAEEFHDPLFPGYGTAPVLAAKCLGLIGDKKAIIILFESIGTGDFFDDDVILDALHAIGEPAKAFLLRVLHGKPLNEDNERAAIAILAFKEDPEVSEACLNLLKDPDVRQDLSLATYLVLGCENLKDPKQRAAFKELADDPKTPKALRQDFKAIIQQHKSQ